MCAVRRAPRAGAGRSNEPVSANLTFAPPPLTPQAYARARIAEKAKFKEWLAAQPYDDEVEGATA